jgi:putative membrane-bound dehydrogenase-like protein
MPSPPRPSRRPNLAQVTLLGLLALAATNVQPARAEDSRETPLTPEQELATFQLDDKRLTIELVAAEPRIDSPVAISWDADGRLYVAEMIDYPVGPTAGRIRLLEDRDGDGRYERDSVFTEGLNFPNGVLTAQGGVFVTAAPDLLFLKDTNADGKADEKRVVFTGFGEGNQQLRANGLTWGLDNWIYGANGRSDGNVRRPQDPKERAISIRARDFRFRPDGSQFEATSGQSQFGQAGDDWGNRFLSWNTIPIRQTLFDQAFLDRNPRLSMHGVRDIADPADTGQVFAISPRPQTFNRERTDYFNALCGLTIYRGDGLGDDYVGSAFVGESLTNLVHRRALTPAGPTFVSRRGEHGREFLASTDSWFHPVYMATGPDGALYVVDFYRRWVEHPAFVAESLRQGIDWQKGTGHGRIWKVSRPDKTWPPGPAPRMSSESTADVVKHIESPNGWWRDTAQRVLVERHDLQAVSSLRALVQKSRLAQARMQALATLDGLSALDENTLLRGLDDAEPHVRSHALRLAAPRLARSSELRQRVVALADVRNGLVRFNVALAMGGVEGQGKVAALVNLAKHEVADPWIPLALVGSLGRSAGDFLTQLVRADADWQRKPSAAQIRLLGEVSAAIGLADDDDARSACLDLISPAKSRAAGPGDLAILAGLARGLADRGHSLRSIVEQPTGPTKSQRASIGVLLGAARAMAVAEDESLDHRLVAIEVLGLLDSQSGKILLDLLDARQPQALQSAAAGALAQSDSATAGQMFAAWGTMTITTRRALVSAALRSAAATAALVAAMEEERIVLRELEPALRDALLAVRDPALQSRIKPLLKANASDGNRQDVVAKFQGVLELAGDRQRGAAVFEKHCLACHAMQGRGQRVGPDLSGIGGRPKETLLVDLFDPSRQVSPDFVSYTLVTRTGQVLTGLVVSETATSVTLRRAEGAQDTVLRAQIEELRGTGKSVMPEGLEQTLSEENVADVLEFLARPDARLFSAAK